MRDEEVVDRVAAFLVEVGPSTLSEIWLEMGMEAGIAHSAVSEALDTLAEFGELRQGSVLDHETWLPLYSIRRRKSTPNARS